MDFRDRYNKTKEHSFLPICVWNIVYSWGRFLSPVLFLRKDKSSIKYTPSLAVSQMRGIVLIVLYLLPAFSKLSSLVGTKLLNKTPIDKLKTCGFIYRHEGELIWKYCELLYYLDSSDILKIFSKIFAWGLRSVRLPLLNLITIEKRY